MLSACGKNGSRAATPAPDGDEVRERRPLTSSFPVTCPLIIFAGCSRLRRDEQAAQFSHLFAFVRRDYWRTSVQFSTTNSAEFEEIVRVRVARVRLWIRCTICSARYRVTMQTS